MATIFLTTFQMHFPVLCFESNFTELFSQSSNCSARRIYRGLISPNNSRETSIAVLLGRGMGVFHEIIVWPKFYVRIQCNVRVHAIMPQFTCVCMSPSASMS